VTDDLSPKRLLELLPILDLKTYFDHKTLSKNDRLFDTLFDPIRVQYFLGDAPDLLYGSVLEYSYVHSCRYSNLISPKGMVAPSTMELIKKLPDLADTMKARIDSGEFSCRDRQTTLSALRTEIARALNPPASLPTVDKDKTVEYSSLVTGANLQAPPFTATGTTNTTNGIGGRVDIDISTNEALAGRAVFGMIAPPPVAPISTIFASPETSQTPAPPLFAYSGLSRQDRRNMSPEVQISAVREEVLARMRTSIATRKELEYQVLLKNEEYNEIRHNEDASEFDQACCKEALDEMLRKRRASQAEHKALVNVFEELQIAKHHRASQDFASLVEDVAVNLLVIANPTNLQARRRWGMQVPSRDMGPSVR
jgi:hypothetical protein